MFVFRESTRDDLREVAVWLRARTIPGDIDDPIGSHGLVDNMTWSQDTAATVGDTVEWELNTRLHGPVHKDLVLRVRFPSGVTPVVNPEVLEQTGAREYTLQWVPAFAQGPSVIFRGTVNSNTGKCPGSEFLSVEAEGGGSILGVAVAPLVIFDRAACKQSQQSAVGLFSPARQVWDWNLDKKGPLSGPVLNSYTNTPVYGDERAFLDAALATKRAPGNFSNLTPVSAFGDRVLVRFYVINDANAHVEPPLVAKDTRVRLEIPPTPSSAFRLRGIISSSNVEPSAVEDTTDVISDMRFRLQYVSGSARQYSNYAPRGLRLADNIVDEEGALVGSREPNGMLLPDFGGSLLITLELRAVKA